MYELFIEFTTSINNQIPLWSIFVAAAMGAYFIINMNFKITLLKNEIDEQKKTLNEIKSLVYSLLTPEKAKDYNNKK